MTKSPQNRSLFASRIPRVAAVTDGSHVPVHNSSEAVFAISGDGKRWVKKYVGGCNELLAEALGTLLAIDLKVPTAFGGVYVDAQNQAHWLSELINPALHWEPRFIAQLADPSELGALLGLDAIIGNIDRNAGNIILRPSPKETELRVFSIDLADSWVGSPDDLDKSGLSAPPPCKAGGIPAELIANGARALAIRATVIPDAQILDSVREACMIAEEPKERLLYDALIRRLRAAPQVVDFYLESLSKT